MGDWLRGPLKGAFESGELVVIVAMHENTAGHPPTGADLREWKEQLGFDATVLLLDPARDIIDAYFASNPGPRYTQAVTVIIDRDLTIRRVGGTYDTDHQANLTLLEQLLSPQ